MKGELRLRFLALGDSYTIGEGVAPAERWPDRLARLLRAEGLPVGAPEIIARTGWTADELWAGIDEADPRGPYDLVTLLVGVNNQYRGLDLDEYRAGFRRLLVRAVALAGGNAGRAIVISIPDWGVTPYAEGRDRGQIAAEIDRFNGVNRGEAHRHRVRYVDVTPLSRRKSGSELVADDGLHPSGEMYEMWTGLILPAARGALGGGSGETS